MNKVRWIVCHNKDIRIRISLNVWRQWARYPSCWRCSWLQLQNISQWQNFAPNNLLDFVKVLVFYNYVTFLDFPGVTAEYTCRGLYYRTSSRTYSRFMERPTRHLYVTISHVFGWYLIKLHSYGWHEDRK